MKKSMLIAKAALRVLPFLFLFQLGFAQAPPVAGLDSNNVTVSLTSTVGEYRFVVPNTASGTIDSYTYRATTIFGYPIFNYTITQFYSTINQTYTPMGGYATILLTQVVTNTFGSDSVTITIDLDCNHLTPPIAYWLTASYNLPAATFGTQTTDNAWGRDVFVNGPFLISSGYHPQWGVGTDTFSLPGPAYVCGYFYNGTCAHNPHIVCDTFNLPCWQPPVVAFTSVANGTSVIFTSNVTATAGASYSWDFGDGNFAYQHSPGHTYAQGGTYFPCLTVTDTCGTSTYCESNGLVVVGLDQSQRSKMEITPNPNTGTFILSIEGLSQGTAQLNIYDLPGKLLQTMDLGHPLGSIHQEFKFLLPKGLYLVELLKEDGNRWARKMLVE